MGVISGNITASVEDFASELASPCKLMLPTCAVSLWIYNVVSIFTVHIIVEHLYYVVGFTFVL